MVQTEALECSALLAIGEIKKRRRIGVREVHTGSRVVQIDRLIGVPIRQRFQQNSVDHAENRAVGPDSDRQSEGGNKCKHRRAGKPPKNVHESHCVSDAVSGKMFRFTIVYF